MIEEIDDDDIDNKHYDLGEFDEVSPFSRDMPDESAVAKLRPVSQTSQTHQGHASSSPRTSSQSVGASQSSGSSARRDQPLPSAQRDIPEHMKQWAVLYPLYFDKNRSLAEGRCVAAENAVENPLAVTIADAVTQLGFECAIELHKQHPKDWANPGRVRVKLPTGRSKREVLIGISSFLKSHPSSEATARVSMYKQLALFDSIKPLAVPRGWKIGSVLPGLSPCLSAKQSLDEVMKNESGEMAKMMGGGM